MKRGVHAPMGEYHRKGFGLKNTVKPMLEAAYASRVVDLLRAKGHTIKRGELTIRLAKEFGFCYGVERAVDIAYQARHQFKDKRIFITNEIIHNASVNKRLFDMGFIFLSGPYNKGETYSDIKSEDVVILPAFGAAVKEIDVLRQKGCTLVDTTCGAVVNVWKNVEKYAKDKFTSLIHGKYNHEETIATSSRAGGKYLVVRDLDETDYACDYIRGKGNREDFMKKFAKAVSPGFDPDTDLSHLGVANQTTMLSTESMEIAARFRAAFVEKYGEEETKTRFRMQDTICSATQDRQDAVNEMMNEKPDVMIVIGGYNSSNTTHLAEIPLHNGVPAYHIDDAACMISRSQIKHLPIGTHEEVICENWFPTKRPLVIGVTAGASTPNNKIGDTIVRLLELFGDNLEDFIAEVEALGPGLPQDIQDALRPPEQK
ncbi:MAG TPA: 4-hydroxy-3-methylbut-2-enyl diphosphate reductase [Planctomycetota bacterium]|nr:4-hydroxy-3-methylbut-2-enyl diphosphate reductase [Planctomycetota bacterium]